MTSKTWAIAVAALVAGAAACSKGNVSVSAKSQTAATDGGTSASTCPLSLNGGDICITRIQMAVKKVKLEGSGEAATPATPDGGPSDGGMNALVADHGGGDGSGSGGDGEGEDEGDEIKVGPCLIDLSDAALASGTLTPAVCSGSVPSGTFNEIEVVIAPVPSGQSTASTDALQGNSVVIDGSYKGTTPTSPAHLFTSTLHVDQKSESSTPVSNVTLTFDPTHWFTAEDGTTLDPTNSANESEIEKNIKASIRSFCDDNKDGEDDHGHDGSGHH